MKFLRNLLDKLEEPFKKGGKLEKLYPVYEMHDTILFTPGNVTKGTTHVRDALDLKRMMITVVIALIPCLFMACYNTGYQANLAISKMGAKPLDIWQTSVFVWLGFKHDASSFLSNFVYGLLFFAPIWATVMAMGGIVEVGTAVVRGHEITEGFLVSGFLIPLTLPPTIPLWQVAMGTFFGIFIGKEIFGGVGMNILNPALTARAFLFFAYPAQISGDSPWIAANMLGVKGASTLPDAVSGATWLGKAASSKAALSGVGFKEWWDAFIGLVPGSMGETSVLACAIGAGILIYMQIASWRTMAGVVLGTIGTCLLLSLVGSSTNPMFAIPWYWHMVIGGWAFGLVYMATDPVSSSFTEQGKWIYGTLIGVLVILVRVVNPAYPEGMMLAILFMNMFAPFIDYFYVQANIKRRLSRDAA